MKAFRKCLPLWCLLDTELDPTTVTEAGACPHLRAELMFTFGKRRNGVEEAPPGAVFTSDPHPGALTSVISKNTGSRLSLSRFGRGDIFS